MWYDNSTWANPNDPSTAGAGSSVALGYAKGIDPRNYATHDDWANAYSAAVNPQAGGGGGVWLTGDQNRTFGGSSGQFAPPTPTKLAADSPLWNSPTPLAQTSQPNMWAGGTPGFNEMGGQVGAPTSANRTAADYAYNPQQYLDPSMAFTMSNGLRALGSSASAAGQTFSGNTLKDILGYSQGLAGQNWNQAAGQAAQQQGFNRGVDTSNTQLNQSQQGITNAQNQYNQNFGYQAALNDQTIPWNQQMQAAQLGLGAQGQQSTLSQTLATLLSGNLGTLGQIQGSGTIGANNSITNAISQMLAGLTRNNTLNLALPQGG